MIINEIITPDITYVDATEIGKKFCTIFFHNPGLVVKSPGRINIIGEHTDYNDGFVLPAAIDKYVYVAVSKRNDEKIHLYAEAFQSHFVVNVNAIGESRHTWTDYILGIVDQLQKGDYKVGGFNIFLTSNLPIGAGLSSSAAVECATIFALNEVFHLNLTKIEMVQLAQKAEHHFAKVKCGIMDMFCSMFGKADHAIKLDCRSLSYAYIPLQLSDVQIVLMNSNVTHSLLASGYNTRREQCEQGVTWVNESFASVTHLRDIDLSMLNEYVLPKSNLVYKRCKYVVEENQRLLEAVAALQDGKVDVLGSIMYETHDGLCKDFEVSCEELDFLIEKAKQNANIVGARMMGGGFGGCTINLIRKKNISDTIDDFERAYKSKMGKALTVHVCDIADGTSIVTE